MTTEKKIGWLLVAGAIGVFIPYTILTVSFEYPDILRQDTGEVLTKFHKGGSSLILTWWTFAMFGLPLLVAYIKIGQYLENRAGFIKWVTVAGIVSAVVQVIGLLRWVFVVPVIANNYVTASDPVIQEIAKSSFQTVHQFGGVLLGEHLGQLLTIVWIMMISIAFLKLRLFPGWAGWLGILSSVIYLCAQAELFATVIPGFPAWEKAGFIGSTLWLIWLLITGVFFIRSKDSSS